jgi:hypothetical protein
MSRTLRPLAALAMVALISAGCSNARAETDTGSIGANKTTNRDQAVKFAECMRTNGAREFPDPNAQGEFAYGIESGSSLDPGTPVFQKALTACKDLQPAGYLAKRSPQEQENALKFAQCVRDNGVKDFPDPTEDGPLVDTNRIPSAAGRGGRSIPELGAAMQKCRDVMSSAVPRGSR